MCLARLAKAKAASPGRGFHPYFFEKKMFCQILFLCYSKIIIKYIISMVIYDLWSTCHTLVGQCQRCHTSSLSFRQQWHNTTVAGRRERHNDTTTATIVGHRNDEEKGPRDT